MLDAPAKTAETGRSAIDHPNLDQIRLLFDSFEVIITNYPVVSMVLDREATTHSPLQSDAPAVFRLKPRRMRDEGGEMQEEVVRQRPEAPEGRRAPQRAAEPP